MPILKIPNQSIRWLFAELVVVTVGIFIGFQANQWNENRALRSLAAQNVTRAIAEVEFNSSQLREKIDLVRDTSVPIRSALAKLVACNQNGLQDDLERTFSAMGFNFLPDLRTDQIEALSRAEYANVFTSSFLEDLSRFASRQRLRIRNSTENYEDHNDWPLIPFMFGQAQVKASVNPNLTNSPSFYVGADLENICENGDFIKLVWRIRALRNANQGDYESHLNLIEEFEPVLQRQLELII